MAEEEPNYRYTTEPVEESLLTGNKGLEPATEPVTGHEDSSTCIQVLGVGAGKSHLVPSTFSNTETEFAGRSTTNTTSTMNSLFDFKRKIKISPILLGFVSSMDNKSAVEALNGMLERNHSTNDIPNQYYPLPKSFSCHHVIATRPTSELPCCIGDVRDPKSFYNFAIQSHHRISELLTSNLHKTAEESDVELDKEADFALKHMQDVFNFLEAHKCVKSPKEPKEAIDNLILGIMNSSLALIKVWNISLGTNVMYFLRKFSGHLIHLHLWLFYEMCEKKLATSADESKITDWGTPLDSLIRSLKLCKGVTTGKRRKPCCLFASNRRNEEDDTVAAIDHKDATSLESEVLRKAEQLKVDDNLEESIDYNWTHFKVQSKLKELSYLKTKSELVLMPLSMLFLRGSLEKQKGIFMKKSELQKLANKWELHNVDEFCKLFTSFGSLFDLGLILTDNDTVIIKPDIFLAKINEAFDCYKGSGLSLKYIRHGIVKTSDVKVLFGQEEGESFMSVLTDVGMAASIPHGKYLHNDERSSTNNEVYYYMPCARKTAQLRHNTEPKAIHLLLNIQNSPNFVNFEVFITQFALQERDSIRLQPSEYENVTKLKDINDNVWIKVIYMGNRVEIHLNRATNTNIDVLKPYVELLLKAFQKIATGTQEKHGCFTYAVAMVCPVDHQYHLIPDELCSRCESNEYYNLWRQILIDNEELLPMECRLTTRSKITADDITYLATKMESLDETLLMAFDKSLNGVSNKTEFDNKYREAPWFFVMTIITKWIRSGPNMKMKADLARQVLKLSNDDALDHENHERLRQLAKELFQRVIRETNAVTV